MFILAPDVVGQCVGGKLSTELGSGVNFGVSVAELRTRSGSHGGGVMVVVVVVVGGEGVSVARGVMMCAPCCQGFACDAV